MDYLDALNRIPSSAIDEWSDMEFVARDAWVWGKAQLRVDLCIVRKSGDFWDDCNEEQCWRLRWRRGIRSNALHMFAVRESLIANAFPEVTHYL